MMRTGILVINAGSSSIKFAVFTVNEGDPAPVVRGQIESIGAAPCLSIKEAAIQALPVEAADHEAALAHVLDWLDDNLDDVTIAAAGHRVVHGGTRFTAPETVNAGILEDLSALEPLAPHHQPHNVAAIRAIAARRPELRQIACFDTAFHAGQPEEAVRLSLPDEYRQRGIRRYGFHGLSYESIMAQLPGQLGGAALPVRLAIAHLGNGASMAAVRDGRCVATTMGFSTLDGLIMGTRSGSIDPGVLLHLMAEDGMDEPALTDLLYNRSGMLGLSGISADMRTLLHDDSEAAVAAVRIYCYRIGRELGSLAAALGGLDALVFTGGVGEHAADIRADVCGRSAWLGVQMDKPANDRHDSVISTPDSQVSVRVIATDEEMTIARYVRDML